NQPSLRRPLLLSSFALLHQSEAQLLSLQPFAHSFRVYPGWPQERTFPFWSAHQAPWRELRSRRHGTAAHAHKEPVATAQRERGRQGYPTEAGIPYKGGRSAERPTLRSRDKPFEAQGKQKDGPYNFGMPRQDGLAYELRCMPMGWP